MLNSFAKRMELIVQIDEIKETFPKNLAQNAESILGKRVMLTGFWQRKDIFHNLGVGDTIQSGVDHSQKLSDHLSVVETIKHLAD